jgi:hypothetical protein
MTAENRLAVVAVLWVQLVASRACVAVHCRSSPLVKPLVERL